MILNLANVNIATISQTITKNAKRGILRKKVDFFFLLVFERDWLCYIQWTSKSFSFRRFDKYFGFQKRFLVYFGFQTDCRFKADLRCIGAWLQGREISAWIFSRPRLYTVQSNRSTNLSNRAVPLNKAGIQGRFWEYRGLGTNREFFLFDGG